MFVESLSKTPGKNKKTPAGNEKLILFFFLPSLLPTGILIPCIEIRISEIEILTIASADYKNNILYFSLYFQDIVLKR